MFPEQGSFIINKKIEVKEVKSTERLKDTLKKQAFYRNTQQT
jgi:hypothetical protein